MTDQLDLLSYSPPAQKHSATSQAAAKSITPHLGPLHRAVLGLLGEHPDGLTDEEMMDLLDLGGNTVRPRRRELQLMGRIKDSGRVRPTKSGRDAVVWVIG